MQEQSRVLLDFPCPEERLIITDGAHMYGRRIANRAARNVGEQTFDGDRYEFEVFVETPESVSDYGSKLREVPDEGLVLERSDDFSAVRFARHEDLGR